METIGGIIAFLVYALLMYQQNRLLAEQNLIMREQTDSGTKPSIESASLRRYWPLVTMAILTVVTCTAIGYGYYDLHYESQKIWSTPGYVGKEPPKKVWRNEIVPLDGFRYEDCSFENVTFEYDGTTPIQFSHNTISGNYMFKTDSGAIGTFVLFGKEMGLINPTLKLFLPPGTKVDFPYEPNH